MIFVNPECAVIRVSDTVILVVFEGYIKILALRARTPRTFINLLILIEFSLVTSSRFQTLAITLTVVYKVLSLALFVDTMIEQFLCVSVFVFHVRD